MLIVLLLIPKTECAGTLAERILLPIIKYYRLQNNTASLLSLHGTDDEQVMALSH